MVIKLKNSKKALVAGVLTALASANASADARSFAMGDAGIADISNYSATIKNPALLSANKTSDDFSFKVGFNAIGNDEEEVISGIDDIDSLIFELESFSEENDMSQQSNRDQFSLIAGELLDLINLYDNESAGLDIGAEFIVALPSADVSVAVHGSVNGKAGVAPSFSEEDKQFLQDVIDQEESSLDASSLTSEVVTHALSESDIGISFSKSLPSVIPYVGQVNVGTTIKFKQVDIFEDAQPLNDFDTDGITESKITEQFIFADIGLYKSFPNGWTLAAIAKDLGSGVVKGVTDEYKIEPSYEVGVSHNTRFSTVSFDYDLSEKDWFGNIKSEKYASVGVELRAGKHAQIRAGYKADLTDDGNNNVVTAGLGLSPFGLLSVDLSGQMTSEKGYGASFDIGYRF